MHEKRLPRVPEAGGGQGLEPDAYEILRLERLRKAVDGSLASHRAWLLSRYPGLAALEPPAERPLPPAWFLATYRRATPGTVLRPFAPRADRDEGSG